MRRALLLWAGLLAVYTLLDGARGGDAATYLAAARAIAVDGQLPATALGVGYPLVLAPAHALGGADAAGLLAHALSALAFLPALRLARRLVPEPWATRGVLVLALSPPALALGATVSPALPAGGLLAAAALLALRLRGAARVRDGVAAGLPLALVPWLGEEALIAAAPVAVALMVWGWERGRAVVAITALEVLAASALTLVRVNDVLYGGVTPHFAFAAGGSELALVDAARWLPLAGLPVLGAAMLVRSRRSHIARAVAERATAEGAAVVAAGVCVAAAGAAALGGVVSPGAWPVARQLAAALPCAGALAAWGLRGYPRTGLALALATVGSSVALVVADALGPGRP